MILLYFINIKTLYYIYVTPKLVKKIKRSIYYFFAFYRRKGKSIDYLHFSLRIRHDLLYGLCFGRKRRDVMLITFLKYRLCPILLNIRFKNLIIEKHKHSFIIKQRSNEHNLILPLKILISNIVQPPLQLHGPLNLLNRPQKELAKLTQAIRIPTTILHQLSILRLQLIILFLENGYLIIEDGGFLQALGLERLVGMVLGGGGEF